MNYELAKKLKEAGFPFKECSLNEEGTCQNRHCNQTLNDYHFCDPTLSELIEACGEECSVMWKHEKGWSAGDGREGGYLHPDICDVNPFRIGRGSTREEAVAHLWLALNEKKQCTLCNGTGEIVTPAHQEAGRIVEERIDPCICQKRDDE